MVNNPGFTVIIPVYNKFPHLERSITSVLNQTYPDLELILIDDASTDGSSEKILEFKDPRIKQLRRKVPGPGGYAARNLGIAHAKKEWVCFLDADDEWELDVLETLTGVIQSNPGVEILCWGWIKVRGDIKILDVYSKKFEGKQLKSFTLTDFFNGPQPMWTGGISMKKELVKRAGAFPEAGYSRGGDMDTWIRCLWQSRKSLRIIRPMTYYYLDSVNMVTRTVDRTTSYIFSPFIRELLATTNDKELAKSIIHFQNGRIYSILSEKISKRQSIDYHLLFKMNINLLFLYYFCRLHLKEVLVKTGLMKLIKLKCLS